MRDEWPTFPLEYRLRLESGGTECISLDGVGGFFQAAESMRDASRDVFGDDHAVTLAYQALVESLLPVQLTEQELAECEEW